MTVELKDNETQKKPLHLFEGYGIELEYMIVDDKTLDVKPICDSLIHSIVGSYASDVDCGTISYSNELALHVLEFKTTKPEAKISGLEDDFQHHVNVINQKLKPLHACLLPTAAHPWMDPYSETKLWAHEHNPVYELYHKIFDCRGHGWSNLQSTHINLPFATDEEFKDLHGAIRFILPILPALSASSPILEGKVQDKLDKRLDVYKNNQKKVPSITQDVVPEIINSFNEYHSKILERIYKDITPHDPDKILQYEWLNSRGAIARFDRSSIEIRILDIQECPKADLAVAYLIVYALKKLINKKPGEKALWHNFKQEELIHIFDATVESADQAIIENKEYIKYFGANSTSMKAKDLWKCIAQDLIQQPKKEYASYIPFWENIFNNGTLATRIVKACKGKYNKETLVKVYKELASCLEEGRMFQ